MKEIYKNGEIVWAKLEGFPWWPGQITRVIIKRKIISDNRNKIKNVFYDKNLKFKIYFFYDNKYSIINFDNIHKYIKFYKEHSLIKSNKLLKAIKISKNYFIENEKKLNSRIKFEILGLKRIKKIKTQKIIRKKIRRQLKKIKLETIERRVKKIFSNGRGRIKKKSNK